MKRTKFLVLIFLLTALFTLAGCSEEVTIDCAPASGVPLSDIPVSVRYDDNALECVMTWYILIDGEQYELAPDDVLGNGQYVLSVRYTLPEGKEKAAEEAEVLLNFEGGTVLRTQVLSGAECLTAIQFSCDTGESIPESLKKNITIRSESTAADTALADIDLSVLQGEEALEYTASWYVDRDGQWYKLAADDYLGSGTYELRVSYTVPNVLGGENGDGLSLTVDCGVGETENTHVAKNSVCTTAIRFRFEEGRHFCNHAAAASSPLRGTCTEGLSYTGVCYKCGEEVVEEIPAQDHTLDKTVADTVEPTCVEDGHRTGPCRICGESITEVIPATGVHNYWRSRPQTHCPEGVLYYLHCHACGKNAEERLPPQPHQYNCTSHLSFRGHMWVCSVCMDFYTESHKYDANGRCTVCGYTK